MKTNHLKSMNPQVRFTLTLNATWSVLRDPVLTKIYARQWKRYVSRATKEIAPTERLLTLYGYVFNVMYHEVQDGAKRLQDAPMALQARGERLAFGKQVAMNGARLHWATATSALPTRSRSSLEPHNPCAKVAQGQRKRKKDRQEND